jgi:hypothetical protein
MLLLSKLKARRVAAGFRVACALILVQVRVLNVQHPTFPMGWTVTSLERRERGANTMIVDMQLISSTGATLSRRAPGRQPSICIVFAGAI